MSAKLEELATSDPSALDELARELVSSLQRYVFVRIIWRCGRRAGSPAAWRGQNSYGPWPRHISNLGLGAITEDLGSDRVRARLWCRSPRFRARHPSISGLVAQTGADGASPGGAPVSGTDSQSRVAAYLHNRWKQRSIRDKMPDA